MAEGLSRKKRIRAGHRASATRTMKQIDALLAVPGAEEPKLAQLKLSLEEKLETLKQLDTEMLELTGEEELENEIQQADEFKDEIYSALVKLRPASVSAPVLVTTTSRVLPPSDDRIKLPKLTIPPFEGDITQWMPFWDSYDSAIHKNSSLTGIDKFNYLRSLLKGDAREAISGLMLTTANYDEAIAILKKRYGNKQAIVSRHMDALMALQTVTSDNNTKALRHLYDKVESNVRSLSALGVAADTYGSLLSSVIASKLPNGLRLIISRRVGEGEWTLQTILKELALEIEARERMFASTTDSNLPAKRLKEPGTTAALLSKGVPLQCCFCNQHHLSEKCQVMRGPDERKQSLRRTGRCFLCLAKGHLSRQCRSRARCSECNGRHHCAICGESADLNLKGLDLKDALPGASRDSRTSTSAKLDPEAIPFRHPSTSLLVGARGAVLLQTASVPVYNPDEPGHSMEFRAILDTGSQQSYASQRIKDTLALRCCRKQTSMTMFSSNDQTAQGCDVVRVGLMTRDGRGQELELFVVPFICHPLTAQPIDLCASKYKHLADLDLADTSHDGTSMEVDLLLGSDCYWTFVTGEIRRGDAGPVAIHTRLGWVLSGVTPVSRKPRTSHSFLTTHVLQIDASPHCSESLDEVLHSFWNLESLGIEDPGNTVLHC